MYEKKMYRDVRCPLERGMEIFGGKWKSRVICVLAEKKVLRYSELRKHMINVTDTVLAATLKELISDNIIQRKQYDEMPPKVEYSLTERGASLVPILQEICRWSGITQKEDYQNSMPQCKKCDYYN